MSDETFNNELQNHDLDRVIRGALSLDADSIGVERLEQYWRVESRKDRWRRRTYFALTTAAAAVVLIGLLVVAKDGDEGAKTASVTLEPAQDLAGDQEEVDATETEGANELAPVPVRPSSLQSSPEARGDGTALAGRAPTEYERFVFIARTGKPTLATVRGNVDEMTRPRPANTEEVLAEIERSGGVDGLVRTAKQGREPKLQRAAIARLLAIESEEALLAFLALVRDGSTQAGALAVAESASELPLDAFLALLDHENKAVRRSAALLLGHVNGPKVTQALIARVTEAPEATEAWMALVACRGERAKQFVAYAATRPQLLGHLNGARVQMAYVIP